MNDDDPKSSVVIDVTPETEGDNQAPENGPPPASEPEPAAATQRPQSNKAAMAIAVVALLAAGALTAVGYRYTQTLDQRLGALEAQQRAVASAQQTLQQAVTDATAALQNQSGTLDQQQSVLAEQRLAVDEARAAFEAQEQRLADENLRLQEREAELRAAVADVHRRVGRSGTQWMIAETEYLLRIANHRLALARDTLTARTALELADQRLRDTEDPGWAGVRAQIARDITKLSTFEAPDIAGLSARLAATIEQVPQLQIARATIGAERTLPDTVAREPAERSWETLVEDLWAGFKDAVRIRERDQPVAAMLAPENQFFLYENLKLHLEAARLGLARGDQAAFASNLATALDWVARYFTTDGVSQAISATLTELGAIDIQPPLPDISQSLRALTVRQQLLDGFPPPEPAANEPLLTPPTQ